MQRTLAILVGIAVLGAGGHLSRLHTHAYAGHQHPEHQHGLASHTHDLGAQQVAGDDEERPHVESCDAERHARSFTFGCAAALSISAFQADVIAAPSIAPTVTVEVAANVTDVRAHGPPAIGLVPSRAPPPHCPA